MNFRIRFFFLLFLVITLFIPNAFGQSIQDILGPGDKPTGFAYDPLKEEGSHDLTMFEWWYHFGFLKSKGSDQYDYSFVSSFQRFHAPQLFRIMFYNLTELKTGKKYHFGMIGAGPGVTEDMLPEGYSFIPDPEPPCGTPESEIWFCYGDNSIKKVGDLYKLSYKNEAYTLDMTLERNGPPMPVNGNGLQGMVAPEDQYYYTFPRVLTQGTLMMKDGKKTELTGDFWYDHQWGIQRVPIKSKWCWLGFNLENGENLSLFFLQDKDTNEKVQWGFTRHHPDGKTEFYKNVTFTPVRKWTSTHALTYDVKWKIEVPEIGLVLDAEAYNDDHEVSNMAGYIWEGPCRAKVKYADGSTTQGLGFLEMIGQPVAGSEK